MKLPNHQLAIVRKEKLVGYLLSTTHRDGRHKAVFFAGFGFSEENWQALAKALICHAAEHEIAKEEQSIFGIRFVLDGKVAMEDGREAFVRTVWFIESGTDVPRFVTAYPLQG